MLFIFEPLSFINFFALFIVSIFIGPSAQAKLQKSSRCLNKIETTALLETLVPFPSKRWQSWRSNDMCRLQLSCWDVWNPTFLGDRKKLLKINVTKNIVFYSSCSLKTNGLQLNVLIKRALMQRKRGRDQKTLPPRETFTAAPFLICGVPRLGNQTEI